MQEAWIKWYTVILLLPHDRPIRFTGCQVYWFLVFNPEEYHIGVISIFRADMAIVLSLSPATWHFQRVPMNVLSFLLPQGRDKLNS